MTQSENLSLISVVTHLQWISFFFFFFCSTTGVASLGIHTSWAGREPGSDSSLARRWTTPSCLLRLHRDNVCLETQGSGIHWKLSGCQLLAAEEQSEKINTYQTFVAVRIEKKEHKRFLHDTGFFFKGEIVWSCSPAGSASPLWPCRLARLIAETSQSQRSGCRFTGDILTSAGRLNTWELVLKPEVGA